MKDDRLTEYVERMADMEEELWKRWEEEELEEIEDFGQPEKFLGQSLKADPVWQPYIVNGKLPYEVWGRNPQILTILGQIYGTDNENPLARLIAKKEWEQLKV